MRKLYSILILLLISPLALADFNKALESYEKGEFEEAYTQFKSMAELGDTRSQFNLGVMYFNGEFVTQDANTAYAWMKLAANAETASEHQKSVFKTISSKIENKEKAEKVFRQLDNLYSVDALLAKLYPVIIKPKNGASFSAKPIKIVEPKYPKKAAMKGLQGWARFQFDIDKKGAPRNIVLLEHFPTEDFAKASRKVIKRWRFEPAKDAEGNPKMEKGLSYTVEFRIGDTGIKVKEVFYQNLKSKAMEGDPAAQFMFGFYHKKFSDLEEDVNPNEWFLKSAIQDYPAAQYQLGLSLIRGQGCIEDKAKGIEWLSRSAASGQPNAKQYLGSLASNVLSKESHQKAVALFKEEELSAYAKLDYAWLLATSPYPEVADPKQAIELADDLSHRKFMDEATQYEIKAAAYAALGDFAEAVDMQEDALDKADDMDADTSVIEERLALYKQKKKWF